MKGQPEIDKRRKFLLTADKQGDDDDRNDEVDEDDDKDALIPIKDEAHDWAAEAVGYL